MGVAGQFRLTSLFHALLLTFSLCFWSGQNWSYHDKRCSCGTKELLEEVYFLLWRWEPRVCFASCQTLVRGWEEGRAITISA
jgi:hypothetical protein